MKIWKTFTVLLAVLLLAGCVGCVSGADISHIVITGIDKPVTGVKPDTTASTSTSGIKLGTCTWNGGTDGFNAETQYTVTIPVTNNSGYVFTNSVTATVNGNNADVTVYHTNSM